jgi:hypothetical protein
MIVNSESSQSDWLAWTGSESAWSCGFQALLEEHVYGELRNASTTTSLVRGTHFDVQLGADGTVTATPLPGMLAPSGQVRFHRLTPALKGIEFINLSSYSAAIHDYYYAAGALRDSELRRDIGASLAGGLEVIADDVAYAGGSVGLPAVTNVRQGLDALAARGLAGLPDVSMAPGPAVDQYRVAWNNSSGKFVLAPQSGSSGAEIVALINTELGGTTWQSGGTGGGGGGTITSGSNVGTGGALGVFKAASGVQLQFYGFRGQNGIVAQLNASTNSIDYSLDLAYADARYVKASALDDVAFTGAYSSLAGLPTLGSLSAKNLIDFIDIVGTAIATLAEAQAGTAANKLMTPQRVRDAILSQALASSRNIIAGNGLTGGGDMSADRTLAIGTPGTVSGFSANTVSADSHTHALSISAADMLPAFGGLGGYGLMVNTATGTDWLAGGNIAGSIIRFTRIGVDSTDRGTLAGNPAWPADYGLASIYDSGAVASGTWMAMGQGAPRKSGKFLWATLGVRIA